MPETNYFWDEIEDNIMEEFDENGNTTASYTTEPTLYGSVLSQNRGGEKRYFQFDGQGNATNLTDPLGDVTDTLRFSTFGNRTVSQGSAPITYGYCGRYGYYLDNDTASYMIRRRKYGIVFGRWHSCDPLVLGDDINCYRFTKNSPTNMADPSGLLCWENSVKDQSATHACGNYKWPVNFKQTKGDPKNGWIVQQVKVKYRSRNCDKTSVLRSAKCPKGYSREEGEAENFIYYELWAIENNEVKGFQREGQLLSTYSHTPTDSFGFVIGGNKTYSDLTDDYGAYIGGRIWIVDAGEKLDLTKPPGGLEHWKFGKQGVPAANGLPSSCEPPKEFAVAEETFRFLAIPSWDCCCDTNVRDTERGNDAFKCS